MGTQQRLAEFICATSAADMNPAVRQLAETGIIDTIGVALGGSREPLATAVLAALRDSGELTGAAGSILIGRRDRATATGAALYNGTIAHALDYDDYDFPASVHVSCTVVAALLSVADDDHLVDEAFRTAYVIGYEVGGKLGRPLPRARRGAAWHSTGFVGPVACAAAVAKVLGLDPERTGHALGIAASSGAGLRANFGTMAKPLHAGRAAQAGVSAALLARNGFEAAAEAFDGPRGFYRAYGAGDADVIAADAGAELGRLGDPWELERENAFYVKPYPSCAGTHFAIAAALQIARKVDWQSIARIRVGQSAATPLVLTYHRPQGELEAKFSMEYCVAAALRWRRVTAVEFTDESIAEAGVWRLIDRTEVDVDDRVRGSTEHAAVVQVVLDTGETIEVIAGADEDNERGMTADQLRVKFEGCAVGVLGPDRPAALYEALRAAPGRPAAAGRAVAGYLSASGYLPRLRILHPARFGQPGSRAALIVISKRRCYSGYREWAADIVDSFCTPWYTYQYKRSIPRFGKAEFYSSGDI
jgi:2-methylcitrate dehydratase PrpD